MGADNLAEFHRWQDWDWIMRHVPIGVFARPGARLAARGSRAADEYARWRVAAEDAGRLARMTPPAWCFLDVPMMTQSSSAIRARGEWRKG
jgi:nicotinate-nucleotide adenylyltransferase